MSGFVLDFDTQQVVNFLLKDLSQIDQKKAVKRGLTDAAKIFIARGELNLRARLKGTGKGNLIRAFRRGWSQKNATAYAGFYKDKKLDSMPRFGNHAHLVDLGTTHRYTKSGAYRGVMPANYFWHDARYMGEKDAYDAIVDGVQEAILRMQERAG